MSLTKEFVKSLRSKKTRPIGVEALNFDTFRIDLPHLDGVVDLRTLSAMYENIGAMINDRAHAIKVFVTYHPSSPKYWLLDPKSTELGLIDLNVTAADYFKVQQANDANRNKILDEVQQKYAWPKIKAVMEKHNIKCIHFCNENGKDAIDFTY